MNHQPSRMTVGHRLNCLFAALSLALIGLTVLNAVPLTLFLYWVAQSDDRIEVPISRKTQVEIAAAPGEILDLRLLCGRNSPRHSIELDLDVVDVPRARRPKVEAIWDRGLDTWCLYAQTTMPPEATWNGTSMGASLWGTVAVEWEGGEEEWPARQDIRTSFEIPLTLRFVESGQGLTTLEQQREGAWWRVRYLLMADGIFVLVWPIQIQIFWRWATRATNPWKGVWHSYFMMFKRFAIPADDRPDFGPRWLWNWLERVRMWTSEASAVRSKKPSDTDEDW